MADCAHWGLQCLDCIRHHLQGFCRLIEHRDLAFEEDREDMKFVLYVLDLFQLFDLFVDAVEVFGIGTLICRVFVFCILFPGFRSEFIEYFGLLIGP